ncbi:MAG: aldo/keto reductase, partial [Halobacteriota archaeon]
AYSPLARGRVLKDETIGAIADAADATPAQVALAWLMRDDDVVPIPKSGSERHIEENLAATAVELADEELARIDAIDDRRRIVDPSAAPWNR